MSAKIAYRWAYELRRRKDGSPGRRVDNVRYAYCPIGQCQSCGRWGSESWVRKWYARPISRSWHLAPGGQRRLGYDDTAEGIRCMGCMNRIRPVWAQMAIVEENRLLLGRINRESARRARQDTDNRCAA